MKNIFNSKLSKPQLNKVMKAVVIFSGRWPKQVKKLLIVCIAGIFFFDFSSCKKFVEVDAPITSLTSASVYNSPSTAAAVLSGIYTDMGSNGNFADGVNSIGYLAGLLADELENYSTDEKLSAFYSNDLNSSVTGTVPWDNFYNEIYVANAVIEGVSASTGLNNTVKQRLTGEAKFVRAFIYFYATNLYSDVPLLTTTNYKINNLPDRTSQDTVYQQIISDLKDAESLLPNTYVDALGNPASDRVRPNKFAAASMLARVYLYKNDWADAEAESSKVINSSLYSLSSLDQAFVKSSLGNNEAIWQLESVYPGANTWDGTLYVLTSAPGAGIYDVSLSDNLLTSFEAGDNRKTEWIDSFTDNGQTYYYPYKYKIGNVDDANPINEYAMVLRLAEQYLIRAEARAKQNNISGAQDDLNVIRNRAGLGNTNAGDQSSLLQAILHERQVELFTEWGHRWFDLRRTGNIDNVMNTVTPQKGGTWSSFKQLFPIPSDAILGNPNLVQNPGYQ